MAEKKYVTKTDVADKFHEMLGIAYGEMVDVLACVDIADVVEVVRCKDCKYRTWFVPYYGCGNYESPFYAGVDEDVPILTKPDDFCSYGERKAVE